MIKIILILLTLGIVGTIIWQTSSQDEEPMVQMPVDDKPMQPASSASEEQDEMMIDQSETAVEDYDQAVEDRSMPELAQEPQEPNEAMPDQFEATMEGSIPAAEGHSMPQVVHDPIVPDGSPNIPNSYGQSKRILNEKVEETAEVFSPETEDESVAEIAQEPVAQDEASSSGLTTEEKAFYTQQRDQAEQEMKQLLSQYMSALQDPAQRAAIEETVKVKQEIYSEAVSKLKGQ